MQQADQKTDQPDEIYKPCNYMRLTCILRFV
jgi:hypothetical protein